MRIDQGISPRLPEGTSPDRPATARRRAKWTSTAVLALLMAGTSWAVASWVSAWLVPPYLTLMALLLSPSPGRPRGGPASEGSEMSESSQPAGPDAGPDVIDPGSDASPPVEGSGEGSGPGPAAKAPRGRRGKGKARKARVLPEPVEATWIEVGPGKFVRSDASDESPGQAGPHALVGSPVAVPAPPQSRDFEGEDSSDPADGPAVDRAPQGVGSAIEIVGGSSREFDPFEDTPEAAEPARFDPVEAVPGGDPDGGVESGPSPDREEDAEAESPGTFEGPSAADGNAPQAEGPFEVSPAESSDAPLDEVEGQAWADPGREGVEAEGDTSPPTEPSEPTGPLALADVPPEEVDDGGAIYEEADPTETAVDETVLDDAGPDAVSPPESEPSEDADPSGPDAPADVPGLPQRWTRRLAPRASTRVGLPPRAADRRTPPGRAIRSHGPARRPPDPRRLGRQGLGRPRRAYRTFPPRSPPRPSAVGGEVAA